MSPMFSPAPGTDGRKDYTQNESAYRNQAQPIEAFEVAVRELIYMGFDVEHQNERFVEPILQGINKATVELLRGLVGEDETWNAGDAEFKSGSPAQHLYSQAGRNSLRQELRQQADNLNRVEGDSND